MAIDKAVDSTVLDGYFSDIADAIRTKKSVSDTYTPAQMAQAIADIGGSDDRLEKILFGNLGSLDITDLDTQTQLMDYSFYQRKDITEFIASSSLLGTGYQCFGSCSNLTDVAAPGLTIINNFAFNSCSKLENLITAPIEVLGNSAFSACLALTDISLSDYLETVPSSCFSGCTALALDELPDAITIIKSNAFKNCINLQLAALPQSIRTLEADAFSGCEKITIKELPASITSCAANVFYGCDAIEEMDSKLTIAMPNNLFNSCTGLKTAKIRNSAMGTSSTSLTGPFQNCTSLEKVWISSNCVTVYGNQTSGKSSPFYGCNAGLLEIYCEAAAKPSGWATYWNYVSSYVPATVHWGVTEADFDAIVAGGN